MGIDVITEFIAKATVRTRVHVYDDADALVEPTSVRITITDPKAVKKVNAVEIVVDGKVENGIYEHYYNTATDSEKGWWLGEVVVVDGTGQTAKTTPIPFSFKVK